MVKLSDRLNAVAKEFKRGETMADIDTDHEYLPVYQAPLDDAALAAPKVKYDLLHGLKKLTTDRKSVV